MVLQPIITRCIHIDGGAHNHNRRWGAYLIEYAHCARIKSTYGPNLDHVLRALPVANSGRPKSEPIAIDRQLKTEGSDRNRRRQSVGTSADVIFV